MFITPWSGDSSSDWRYKRDRCCLPYHSWSRKLALNLILVVVFHLGVAGVAVGTILSQLISSILVVRCLCKAEAELSASFF